MKVLGDIVGFRSSFRDWAAEQAIRVKPPKRHTIPNAAERAYRRGDLFERRRRLMADWERYCEQKPGASEGRAVVAMRR